MIVSASYRSDIPAFYGEWFRRRRAAGWAAVRNPYGGGTSRVPLAGPEVEGFVFWTRNPRPFLPALDELAEEKLPFVLQVTVTGYPRALDRSVPLSTEVIESCRAIARRFGRRAVVWRYDPVFASSLTPPDWHRRNFAQLAQAFREIGDEVVLSFAQIYAKTKRNSDKAAAREGFTWRDPAPEEKKELLASLAGIARDCGLAPRLCAQPDLLSEGLEPARCIDAARLSELAGREISAPPSKNRPGCLCAAARDIGRYDSCPHGCVYCYAVASQGAAKRRFAAHDPSSEML